MKLSDFAHMPYRAPEKGKTYLDYVAEFSIKEPWGESLQYLERYVDYNFEISYGQNLVLEDPEGTWAIWRVGNLVTPEGEPISILCLRNRMEGKQPYHFARVFRARRIDINANGHSARLEAPVGPAYPIPSYKPGYALVYDFDHYLRDNRQRAEERLPNLTDRQRFLCIYGAAQLAHKRGEQASVPQWYRDKNAECGSFQWLLPLHLIHEDLSRKPDLVATLQPDDAYGEYRVRTLLPPEWAYPNARAISSRDPHFRMWA